jgi:glutamate dehydrogenase/leucine dehydrogenase
MESPLIILASGPTYEGFLVIDSLHRDTSAGGVRIAADLTIEEIEDLAREMTMKFALFRLPRGGAKAGLRLTADLDPRAHQKTLEGFGRQIGPIIRAGLYYPGMDMNCGPLELQAIYTGAGFSIGHPTDSSFFTAISAANALQGCAEALGGSDPITVAVEGFGSVANHMTTMLPPSDFRITAVSTIGGAIVNPEGFSHEELRQKRAKYGDALIHQLPGTQIPREDLFTTSADILVPSARTRVITGNVAGRVRSRAVVPIANSPYGPGAARILHDRGVMCLPGYLCNAGGVFGSSLADSGVSRVDIEEIFRSRYRPLIRTLVEACLRKCLSPVSVVDELAMREANRRAEEPRRVSLPAKLYDRAARRFPLAVKRRAMWKQCNRALDAMESDFRKAGV